MYLPTPDMKLNTTVVRVLLTWGCVGCHLAVGAPILSEVFYDASGSDDQLEWVELYNPTDQSVDLSGYSLGNGGASYATSRVQLGGILAAYSYFVAGGPLSTLANGSPTFDQSVDFNPDFQNGVNPGDGVALFNVPSASVNASTVPIDAVIYGDNNASGLMDSSGNPGSVSASGAPVGGSLVRTTLGGNWQTQASPTPGTGPLPIPEPCTATLVALGLLTFAGKHLRRRKR